jgi:TonB family protein
VTDALKAGHALGNTKVGETSGEPKANLKGRTLNGTLPRPSYPVQANGTVVVKIWVDNYGTVQKAIAGAEGTTVTDKELWNAARKAAMRASFNMSADAPAMQEGTITYIFKLK